MGIVLTVLEPPHHPNTDLVASLPPGIGHVIDVCPRVVSPRFDALLVTSRGLVVRDPGSREFFGVPWSNFSLDDHLRQHSRHAVLSLWLDDKRPVELAIDRRLALNIACVAPALKSNPDMAVEDVVVAKAPEAQQLTVGEPVSSNGHHHPAMESGDGEAPEPSSTGFYADTGQLPDPHTFGTLADDNTYYDDPIITDVDTSVIGLIDPPLESHEPAVEARIFDPSETPTAPLPPVPHSAEIPERLEIAPTASTGFGDGATNDAGRPEPGGSRIDITNELARNAAWAGAAVVLLFLAGLVGSAASGYFSPDEAGTARLLTSESVDLD